MTRCLTEVEAAFRLRCSTFRRARRLLARVKPAFIDSDGPRYTEQQLAGILGAPVAQDPVAAEIQMLADIDRMP